MIPAYVPRPDGFAALVGLILVVWGVAYVIFYLPFSWLQKRRLEKEAKERKVEIACDNTTITIEWIGAGNYWLVTQTYRGKEDVLAAGTFKTWAEAKEGADKQGEVWRQKRHEEAEAYARKQAELRRDPTWQAQEAWEQQKRRYNQRQQRKRRKY